MTLSPTSFIATSTTAHSRIPRSRPDSHSAAREKPAPAWESTSADFDNSGTPGVAITNFDNEMIGLYRFSGKSFEDIAPQSGVGIASRNSLGFGCAFLDVNLDGWLDFAVANGHIDETVRNIRGNVGYAQPPQLFLNRGKGMFREVAAEVGAEVSISRKLAGDWLMATSIAMAISICCLPRTTDPHISIATISSVGIAASAFAWWERSQTVMGSAHECACLWKV